MNSDAPDLHDDAERHLRIWRGQVAPRFPEILASPLLWVSLGLAVASALSFPALPVGRALINDIAGDLINVAAISIGACFTSIVLVIALPGEARIRRWATYRGTRQDRSTLSDLVFAIFWASLSQLVLILTCVVATIAGSGLSLAPTELQFSHLLGLIGGSFAFYYALAQLYVVLQTLVQLSVVIIREEQAMNSPAPNGNDANEISDSR